MSEVTLEKAVVFLREGNLPKAERLLLKLSRGNREDEAVFYHLGVVYFQQRKFALAADTLFRATKFQPDSARAWSVLSLIFEAKGETPKALDFAERASRLSPTDPVYLNNLGKLYLSIGELDKAVRYLTDSNSIAPNSVTNTYNLALAFGRLDRIPESVLLFKKLLDSEQYSHESCVNLMAIHSDNGEHEEALRYLKLALEKYRTHCSSHAFQLLLTIAHLIDIPTIYESEQSLDHYRKTIEDVTYQSTVQVKLIPKKDLIEAESAFIFLFLRLSNFYWGYQGLNDKAINQAYVELIRSCLPRLAGMEIRKGPVKATPEFSKPKKVVFVSEYFGLHATKWIVELYLGIKSTNDTYIFMVLNDWKDKSYIESLTGIGDVRFAQCSEANFLEVFKILRDLRADELVFPDVGMTATSRLLSAFRFAPKQLVHWAHPITTGSPSIDFFVTGEQMEPSDCAEHYTERLVPLPGVGLFLPEPFKPHAPGAIDRPSSRFQIITSQSLFKYHPGDDERYIRIAKRISTVEFLFIEHPNQALTDKFRRRLHKAFDENGMDGTAHIKLLPRLPRPALLDLLHKVGVYLDCFRWSGGNTTLDAIEAAAAIYTLPGDLMRGRHTYGLLKRMGVEQGICETEDELIEKLQLAFTDPEYLNRYRKAIEQCRTRLWRDREVIENFRRHF